MSDTNIDLQNGTSIIKAERGWLVADELVDSQDLYESLADEEVGSVEISLSLPSMTSGNSIEPGDALIFTISKTNFVTALAQATTVTNEHGGGYHANLWVHEDWKNVASEEALIFSPKWRDTSSDILEIPHDIWADLRQILADALYDYTGDESYLDAIESPPSANYGSRSETVDAVEVAKNLSSRELSTISWEEYEALVHAIDSMPIYDKESELQLLKTAFGNQAHKVMQDKSNFSLLKRTMGIDLSDKLNKLDLVVSRDVNHWIMQVRYRRKELKFVVDPFLSRILKWEHYGLVTQEDLRREEQAFLAGKSGA